MNIVKLSVGVLALGALMALPARAETKILYGSGSSPKSSFLVHGVNPWLTRAGELTNGSITFEVQAGGAVVTGKTDLFGVRDGVIDGATIVASYYPNELPIAGGIVTALPFLSGDPRVVSGAVTELMLLECPKCLKEFTDLNIVPIGPFATASYDLVCRKPVATLEDLKGLRVRVPGSAWSRLADALGMAPVQLAVGEMYESLQRGTVDCTFGSLNLLDTLSLGEVAKHVIQMPIGLLFSPTSLDLNLQRWKSLSDAERQALIDSAGIGVAGTAYSYMKSSQTVIDKREEKGLTIGKPDDAMTKVLNEFVASESKAVIADANGKGVADAEKIVADFTRLVDKWKGIVASIPEDEASLAKALNENIYSKFPNVK
ncbi:MAG: C4-dicarboxylate TRAP transporter substrate-binding protein [Rhodobiaceae bacterium]|nr:C4-dicarboxylate TRAP transporter substrate-binding protein [Rhodobiaceae bacterium]MCC0056254.1 C4-dicarboxylate TRAP transporter substrate-binding protein [Rhodobiaceae bacterium]